MVRPRSRTTSLILAVLTVGAAGCQRTSIKVADSTSASPPPPAAADTSASSAPSAAPDTSASSAPSAAPTWTVDAHGIGRIRIGTTLSALSKTLREPLHASYSYNETCDYVRPHTLPAGVRLMVSADTVVRVDVDSAGITTREGTGVGSSEAQVLTAYRGRATVQPHPYTGPVGHYVIVPAPNDTMYRMIFETNGKRVTRYRAGRRPEVDFKEGCS